MNAKRIEWVDVSKVLVIWLMVLGHVLEKTGLDAVVRNMIYSFHMPFFFFISGFLYKNKTSNFWQYTIANAKSLLIPYAFLRLLSCALLMPYIVFVAYDASSFVKDFVNGSAAFPAGATWFLVCFFCVKELYYWIEKLGITIQWFLIIIMAYTSYELPYRLFWNIDAALMAMPFFMVGALYKTPIASIMEQRLLQHKYFLILSSSFLLVLIISSIQGFVTIYEATYGTWPLLFYPCAFLGISVILMICKPLNSNPYIVTFSKGTIVVMGLHGALYPYIMLVYRVLARPLLSAPLNLLCEIVLSIVILLLLYYPIIWLQKYLPFFIGNRR